jgi:hypothetical protein
MTEGVSQVVECLPSKHEILSSNPSTTKKGMKWQERLPSKCETLTSNPSHRKKRGVGGTVRKIVPLRNIVRTKLGNAYNGF